MIEQAYLGLGSNLGDSAKLLTSAVKAIAKIPDVRLLGCSPVYCSQAIGPQQPDYLNMAVVVETPLLPIDLLNYTQEIERLMGRQRSSLRWGPRLIDIDILLFGMRVIDTARLQIPHPQMTKRNFVLQPLLDLTPDLSIPGLGSVLELLAQSTDKPLSLYAET